MFGLGAYLCLDLALRFILGQDFLIDWPSDLQKSPLCPVRILIQNISKNVSRPFVGDPKVRFINRAD